MTVRLAVAGATIESRTSAEGSANVVTSTLPATATTVTFNNLGGVVANATSLTQVNFSAVGATRSLQVKLLAGGTPRMCDPAFAAGDPRAC